MLVYCWATVVDGGPALNQHWVDVSIYLDLMLIHTQRLSRRQAAEQTGGWWAAENAVLDTPIPPVSLC